MRPTSTTNNSKTSGKSQILKTPFVSTPFRDQNSIQQFDEIFVARRFVFLPTQDIILNEIASGESNLVLRSLFWRENLLSRRKMKLIVISTMATDGAAEFMSNYGRSVLIPIYEISRNYEKRKGGGRRIFLSETEIRIYETQVTKSRNLTRY